MIAVVRAALLLVFAAAPAAAADIPSIPDGTTYASARQQLQGAGWVPTQLSRDPKRCFRTLASVCKDYPEVVACSETARCAFFWRRETLMIEVGTENKSGPVVSHVRCRMGCP